MHRDAILQPDRGNRAGKLRGVARLQIASYNLAMPEELIPIFHVKDGYETAKWYARLGFEVEGEHRFAPNLPLYLFIRRGNIRLHLSEHKGDAKPGTLVYFYVHDVDVISEEFGAKVVNQPWAREVKLTDPDGNRLRIGERKE